MKEMAVPADVPQSVGKKGESGVVKMRTTIEWLLTIPPQERQAMEEAHNYVFPLASQIPPVSIPISRGTRGQTNTVNLVAVGGC